ncbi:MAG: DUF1614 domain-containing protein [Nitrospiraceae bacterium]|nr:DUF1614 domain-containing protein [Nitrospiraceae bacterium]
MFFSPFAIIFFFMSLLGLFFFFALIQIGVMTIAFERIGIGPGQVFGFLLLSLFGSYINIPIRRINIGISDMPTKVNFFGMTYKVPKSSYPGTMVAVNVGGALIPIFLSIYLMLKWQIFFEPMFGVAIVSAISYWLARPVRGVGIALPVFIPPLLAALVAILISSTEYAPVVAYISGTLGTLIGADLLHLKDISRIDAPVVSIGGAGTFDGIFLTGIIAVLLA